MTDTAPPPPFTAAEFLAMLTPPASRRPSAYDERTAIIAYLRRHGCDYMADMILMGKHQPPENRS